MTSCPFGRDFCTLSAKIQVCRYCAPLKLSNLLLLPTLGKCRVWLDTSGNTTEIPNVATLLFQVREPMTLFPNPVLCILKFGQVKNHDFGRHEHSKYFGRISNPFLIRDQRQF